MADPGDAGSSCGGDKPDAIDRVLGIPYCDALMGAGDVSSLGRCLCNEWRVAEAEQRFLNMAGIGRAAATKLPGVFAEGSYVRFPDNHSAPRYDGAGLETLPDSGWSLRLKLTSPVNPEGVWLKLPDYSEPNGRMPHEIAFALERLHVSDLSECKITEGRCSLPGVIGLEKEFGNVRTLVACGNDLGYMLDRENGVPVHSCRDLERVFRDADFRSIAQAVGVADALARGKDPRPLAAGLSRTNAVKYLDRNECLARMEQIGFRERAEPAKRSAMRFMDSMTMR